MKFVLCGEDCGRLALPTCYGKGMVTTDNTHAPVILQATLRVQSVPSGRFEVRHGDRLLGTSQNEMMALWSAVGAAEQMAKSGQTVRVVLRQESGDTEVFVARPKP
jgi:hypothetical protein